MAKERYAGPPHLTEDQLIAQRKKIRGDGTILKIGSIAQGFVEDVLTTFSDTRKRARYQYEELSREADRAQINQKADPVAHFTSAQGNAVASKSGKLGPRKSKSTGTTY
jgi:hypothetical protein|tara:strand:- start:633 stop:959 length:327 start_codon:yes stop_codon:yes gene_type:complete